MFELLQLFSQIAIFWILAVITPGPNFILTVQTAIKSSRKNALYVVIGIATGTLLWGLSGFFGIRILFSVAPWFYFLIKIIGVIYLIIFGIKLIYASYIKNKNDQLHIQNREQTSIKAVKTGLITILSNPKTVVFISSLFATTIPENTPVVIGILCVLLIVTITIIWYSLIATLFSLRLFSFKKKYHENWISRISGFLFIFFGLRIALKD